MWEITRTRVIRTLLKQRSVTVVLRLSFRIWDGRKDIVVYRYFFIAKNNIKKQKSDMITFFILAAIASLFIFISLSFMTGAGKVVDTCKEKINGADIFFMLNKNDAAVAKVEEIIKGNVYLKNCETERTVRCSSK